MRFSIFLEHLFITCTQRFLNIDTHNSKMDKLCDIHTKKEIKIQFS